MIKSEIGIRVKDKAKDDFLKNAIYDFHVLN